MKHAWCAYAYANSRLSSQIPISGSSVDSRLFISEANESDSKIQGFLTYINHGKPWQTEDDFDAEVVERLSDYLRSKHHSYQVLRIEKDEVSLGGCKVERRINECSPAVVKLQSMRRRGERSESEVGESPATSIAKGLRRHKTLSLNASSIGKA